MTSSPGATKPSPCAKRTFCILSLPLSVRHTAALTLLSFLVFNWRFTEEVRYAQKIVQIVCQIRVNPELYQCSIGLSKLRNTKTSNNKYINRENFAHPPNETNKMNKASKLTLSCAQHSSRIPASCGADGIFRHVFS